ncbi:hypothetical protein GF323_01205 [Candidatus Woesearchaeota archaeon]|nr:hypothetical protein [Candidatus Woesearchaeota archaeon]
MKKAQITVFVIMGLVILIIAVALLYFSNALKADQAENQNKKISNVKTDLQPVENYMKKCVEKVAKEGLFLLGKQAGYIYQSQGGLTRDPSPGTRSYMNYNSHKVAYRISFSQGGSPCKARLPKYPSNNPYYPYDSRSIALSDFLDSRKAHVITGFSCFGTNKEVIRKELENNLKSYIEKEIPKTCDLSIFKNYKIASSSIAVNISIDDTKTYFEVSYPVTLTNINTNAKSSLDKFIISIDIGLERLINFVNGIILLDVQDPNYKITSESSNEFKIDVIRSGYNDIVEITARRLKLDGSPFKFIFARMNRYPALEYVYNTSFSNFNLSYSSINYSDVIHQELLAVDPDEDQINITVWAGKGVSRREWKKYKNLSITMTDRTNGYVNITVEASDGEYIDYQTENRFEKFIIK